VAAPGAIVYAPFCGVVKALGTWSPKSWSPKSSKDKPYCDGNLLDIKADPDSEFKGYWVRLLYARPAPGIKAQMKVRDSLIKVLGQERFDSISKVKKSQGKF
jgi:hypothetical protein